jgi:hypothetical protein
MIKRNLKKFLIQKWIKCLKNNNLTIIVLLLLFNTNLYSQNTIKVSNVKGIAYITGDTSPNQAKNLALNDAKINALKKAGIEENLKSYQLLFNTEENSEFTQLFSSEIQSEIQGAVQSFEIIKETTIKKSELELYIEITIDAVVIKYDTKPDITFDTNIENIKSVYNNNEKLTFSILTTQDCYLTIFNINDKEATLMYPNKFEKIELLKNKISYNFPLGKVDYYLETDLNSFETNRLIFVFTKSNIPFIKINEDQISTKEKIFNWIYSIPPDQRKVEFYSFIVRK